LHIFEKYPYLDVKCTLRYSVLTEDIIIIFYNIRISGKVYSKGYGKVQERIRGKV